MQDWNFPCETHNRHTIPKHALEYRRYCGQERLWKILKTMVKDSVKLEWIIAQAMEEKDEDIFLKTYKIM